MTVKLPDQTPYIRIIISNEFGNKTNIKKDLSTSSMEELFWGFREALAGAGYAKETIEDWFPENVANFISKDEIEIRGVLSDLLAIIHRDGGHHEVNVGTLNAVKTATEIVSKEREQLNFWKAHSGCNRRE